jgi:hypothetical protein
MGFRPAHPDEKHAGTLLGLISSMPTDLSLGGNGRGMAPLRAPISPESAKKRRRPRSSSKPDPQLAMVQMVGETLLAKLQQMPPRAWIFCMLVLRWRQVERFSSASDLFDWLQSFWVEGRPLLAPATDLREIRNICKLIGLRYGKRRS